MMKLSNNALALFCFISTTSYYTNGFIVRPTAPKIPVNTGLGYIKEGYETGIGPDILIGRRSKQQQKKQQQVQEQQDQPPQKGVVQDGIIDAVVIEEDFYDNDVNDYVNDINANVIADDDDNTISERLKRDISSKSPSSVFPDLYESEKEVLQQQQQTTGSSIWDTTTAKIIQGGSLRTWSMEVPEVDHTQVLMRNSFGYPIRAQLDVYNGPDNVPMKLAVFSTCGLTHPFSCIIPTPGDSKQSIGIKNTGPMEFPIEAVVIADVESVREKQNHQQQQSHQSHQSQQQQQQQGGYGGFYSTVGPTTTMVDSTNEPETSSSSTSTTISTTGLGSFVEQLRELGDVRKIDGSSAVAASYDGCDGGGEIYEFESNVDSVQVLIEAIGGRSCQARIELTYGDSDEIVQVIELAIEDGRDRPFFAVIDTPATTNTRTTTTKIRIVNLDKYSAFPLRACVEPYTISDDDGNNGNDDGNDNYEYGYDCDNNNNNYAAFDGDDDTAASTFNYDEHISSTIPDFTVPVASSNPEESFAMY